jgi:hypothetical protein
LTRKPICPVIIITKSFHEINFCPRDATYWSVETILRTPIHVSSVETLKAGIQWNKTLETKLLFVINVHYAGNYFKNFSEEKNVNALEKNFPYTLKNNTEINMK